MMLKAVIFAVLAVAVMADDFHLPEDKRMQVRDMLKQQCTKNGAADKVDEVENKGKDFMNCIKDFVDLPTVQKEIEEAKPNGALDEVFKKYCAKTPQLKTCIHTLLNGVSPCVDNVAREQIPTAKNATDQLIDFVCYKDGDRIALFIAEGGPQCFKSKSSDIKTCFENLKNSFSSIEEAKAMTLDQRCAKFNDLQNCIVKKLEGCDTPTPANMFESLCKYIRKSTPCNVQTN